MKQCFNISVCHLMNSDRSWWPWYPSLARTDTTSTARTRSGWWRKTAEGMEPTQDILMLSRDTVNLEWEKFINFILRLIINTLFPLSPTVKLIIGSTLKPMPYVLCPMSFVLCPVSYVLCPMFFAFCPMSFVLCPLSYVLCPISFTLHPMSYNLCPMSMVLHGVLWLVICIVLYCIVCTVLNVL